MAGHESPRTTKLYGRTKDENTLSEVERIRLCRVGATAQCTPPLSVVILSTLIGGQTDAPNFEQTPMRRFPSSTLPHYFTKFAQIYSIPIPKQPDLPISYNIALSQNVLAIRYNPETREGSLDQLRWGLIPHWAKDERLRIGPSTRELKPSIKLRRTARRSSNAPV